MFTGPNIVEEGLVLALDAANVKSFKGEPTVNVINGGENRANVVTVPISVGNHASISKSTSLTSYSSDRPNVLRYTSTNNTGCLLYTSPSPRDGLLSRMPSSA